LARSLNSDLDFADNVSVLAELLELLISVLETIASEAPLLGFKVNWQKTKVQAFGTTVNVPPTITVEGKQVAVVIHSSTQSTPDIIQCSGITRVVMQSLDNHFWKSHISSPTKLKLCKTCILLIFQYGSEYWAVTARLMLLISGA